MGSFIYSCLATGGFQGWLACTCWRPHQDHKGPKHYHSVGEAYIPFMRTYGRLDLSIPWLRIIASITQSGMTPSVSLQERAVTSEEMLHYEGLVIAVIFEGIVLCLSHISVKLTLTKASMRSTRVSSQFHIQNA